MLTINSSKGQASFEFMATYAWILMGVLAAIGALMYFNILDPEKYMPEKCELGRNIICEDWSIKKVSEYYFESRLKLKNNLEKPINIVNVDVHDYDGNMLTCTNITVMCPFNMAGGYNWTMDVPNDFNGSWGVGKSCMLYTKCEKPLVQNTKNHLQYNITFRRETHNNDSANHSITGKLFANTI